MGGDRYGLGSGGAEREAVNEARSSEGLNLKSCSV